MIEFIEDVLGCLRFVALIGVVMGITIFAIAIAIRLMTFVGSL
jgi:hypothetical protein